MKELGCETSTNNREVMKANKKSVVILIAKPQILPTIIDEISSHVTPDHLLLSFAAGLEINAMQKRLPPKTRLGRVMTNTAVQYLEGTSSFTLGPYCTDDDRNTVKQLMQSVGYCNEVKENQLDIVTGFAGGGPAYTFCFIESIADGAVLGGMQRGEAIQMATKTVLGAAKTLEQTGLHPAQLKDSICSPGGTTIYGVRALENAGMRGAVIEAVKAASERSKELGLVLNSAFDYDQLK